MVIIMMSVMYECEIFWAIIIALATTLFCWLVANFIFCPRLSIDDKLQHGKKFKFLRVENKHPIMNAYSVECYVEYYRKKEDTHPYYTISLEFGMEGNRCCGE